MDNLPKGPLSEMGCLWPRVRRSVNSLASRDQIATLWPLTTATAINSRRATHDTRIDRCGKCGRRPQRPASPALKFVLRGANLNPNGFLTEQTFANATWLIPACTRPNLVQTSTSMRLMLLPRKMLFKRKHCTAMQLATSAPALMDRIWKTMLRAEQPSSQP